MKIQSGQRPAVGVMWMAAGLCVSIAPLTSAQQAGAQRNTGEQGPFVPWVGEMGITETVAQILARDRQNLKWDGRYRWEADERREPDRHNLPQNPLSANVPQWPWNFNGPNPPTILPPSPLDNPQTISPTQNFLTTTIAEGPGYVPPDSNGAVGPSQIGIFVNGQFKVLDKTTGALVFTVNADTFFNSVRNGIQTSDPNIRYDPISQRWFLTIINVAANSNRVLIARSNAQTLTTASAFTFFFFQQDTVAPAGNAGNFLDYDSLGVDANALYIGGDMFTSSSGSFVNTSSWVVNKASVMGAGPISVTAFRNLLISSSGPYAPRGVDNPDPASTEGYFIGVDGATFSTIMMRRVSSPGGTPSISGNMALAVPTTDYPINVSSSGQDTAASALDDRLFAAQVHKNRLTGVTTLLTSHNIQVTAAGTAGAASPARNGSRWYQIGNLTGSPTLVQSGTLFDSSATGTSYWIPSIAMTGQGHMAIGCSSAAPSTRIGVSTAGRLNSDSTGSTQSPSTIVTGVGTYTGNSGRWGDYSATQVDPVDDQTMWTFQEYMSSNGNWGIRATKLIAPPPATPSSAAPAAVTQGQTGVPIVITGSSASGSGFYDTAVGFNRLQAAFSGTGITVTNIAFTDPTHITLTCDIAAAAATGGRTLTVTNPDGQQATSGAGIVTVNPGGNICPSFTQNPSPVTLCSGTQAQFTVVATGTPAPTYQWRKNTVPMSDGGNISGSATATLTINPAGVGDIASYDCVATNACGSTPSNPAGLTVNTAPGISGQPANASVYAGQPASFTVTASGATGYQWRKNTINLSDGGSISGSATATLSINPTVGTDAGSYDCIVSNACGPTNSNPANLAVNTCYPNCDGSTTPPILNVLDFACFINRYASGDTYANCDNSTTPPVLNVLDFACFINSYATGCS